LKHAWKPAGTGAERLGFSAYILKLPPQEHYCGYLKPNSDFGKDISIIVDLVELIEENTNPTNMTCEDHLGNRAEKNRYKYRQ